jgi:hypothetical protein
MPLNRIELFTIPKKIDSNWFGVKDRFLTGGKVRD